jgi:hypothetical protein
MEPTIKWNADLFGVEIKTEKRHFVISAMPDLYMSDNEAVRFFDSPQGRGEHAWRLPKVAEWRIISAFLNEVNDMMLKNGGFVISIYSFYASNYERRRAYWVGARNFDGNYFGSLRVRSACVIKNK